ncbi:hypothetical protein PFISCL1PPCAC_24092, partial [Pristionchus fissidentatus]
VGDTTEWGAFYIMGNLLACVTLVAVDQFGRKRPLLISIIATSIELFYAFWSSTYNIRMTVFIVFFGWSSLITYVCLFVSALESLPYKLRLPFSVFFFSSRRVSLGIISALALHFEGYLSSVLSCIVFLILAAVIAHLFLDETAAHLLLNEKMYELELLMDKIGKDSDLSPDRSSQQIADELGFREDDVDMTTKDYLAKVFKSKAVIYIVNVVLLV